MGLYKATNSGIQDGEGPKLPQKIASECKKSKYRIRNIRSSTAYTIKNAVIKHLIIVDAPEDCFCVLNASKITR